MDSIRIQLRPSRANPAATRDDIVAFVGDPARSMKSYSDQFVSEDYMFCFRARDAGMQDQEERQKRRG